MNNQRLTNEKILPYMADVIYALYSAEGLEKAGGTKEHTDLRIRCEEELKQIEALAFLRGIGEHEFESLMNRI